MRAKWTCPYCGTVYDEKPTEDGVEGCPECGTTRACRGCGRKLDLPPADARINFCTSCLRAASVRPELPSARRK